MKNSIALSFLFFLTVACSSSEEIKHETNSNEETSEIIETTVEVKEKSLIDLSKEILLSIKEIKWADFASYIHPKKGIRFSPYSHVFKNDVVLNRNDFVLTLSNKKHWGEYDGIGDSIILTTQEYFKQFVYDVDFYNAEIIKQDTIIGSGNSMNNLQEVYPDLHFVEFHFTGFEEKYQGLDWRSLRLVFDEFENEFFLVAIIHDQWTI